MPDSSEFTTELLADVQWTEGRHAHSSRRETPHQEKTSAENANIFDTSPPERQLPHSLYRSTTKMRVSREGHLGIPLSLSVIVATHLVLVNVVAFIPTNNAPLALLSPRPGGVDGGSSLFLMPPNNGGPPDMFVLGDDEDYGGEDEDEDEDDEEYVPDPYTTMASEEFLDQDGASSALTFSPNGELTTIEDWGGALGKLRERVDDVATGKSRDPSHALFRLMSSSTPNQVIGKFVQSANPQTVQAMTGAVSSLLGGM